jgi:hypothetical protein
VVTRDETATPAMLQAEAEIARARENVNTSVSALRQEVARTVDWREWYRRNPGIYLAGAFLIGLYLGRD